MGNTVASNTNNNDVAVTTSKPSDPTPPQPPRNTTTAPIKKIDVDRVYTNNVRGFCQVSSDGQAAVEQMLKKGQNAVYFSHANDSFVKPKAIETLNPLVAAVTLAYANHLAIELTPDVVYNTILQGVSMHMQLPSIADKFKSFFLSDKNQRQKRRLSVQDDSLVGSDASWSNAISAFRAQMLEHTSVKVRPLLARTFSTTGDVEAAAHTACMMDVMKEYFEYTVSTCCGIPRVDLSGVEADWTDMALALDAVLPSIGLETWNAKLQVILDGIRSSYTRDQREFWSGMFKHNGPNGSGEVAHVTGWLAELFPYLQDSVPNPAVFGVDAVVGGRPTDDEPPPEPESFAPFASAAYMAFDDAFAGYVEPPSAIKRRKRVPLSQIPIGRTETEFTWVLLGKHIQMTLIAGLVGIGLTPSGALRPHVGYVVVKDGNNMLNK